MEPCSMPTRLGTNCHWIFERPTLPSLRRHLDPLSCRAEILAVFGFGLPILLIGFVLPIS
jgi:hypothetical protein